MIGWCNVIALCCFLFCSTCGFAVFYFFHVFPGEYGRFGLPVETVHEHPWIVWLSIPMILHHLWIIPGLSPSPIRLRRKWDPTFKRHGEP